MYGNGSINIGHVVRRMRSGCKRIVNGKIDSLWQTS